MIATLSAAIIWSVLALVIWNLVIVHEWHRRKLPTDPRRLVKFVAVSYRQMSAHDRINGALLVALVVVGVMRGMG